jgi:hypothetical protein
MVAVKVLRRQLPVAMDTRVDTDAVGAFGIVQNGSVSMTAAT